MLTYADDIGIYTTSYLSKLIARKLKNHLNVLLTYTNKWKLNISYNKTEVIIHIYYITNANLKLKITI